MTVYRQVSTASQPPALSTPGRSGGPSPFVGAVLPERPDLLASVIEILSQGTRRWAWQGPAGAAARWLTETGPKDLDVWYGSGPPGGQDDPVALICEAFPCARVCVADDPRRLRHTSLAIETPAGPAVIDLTYGDLRVGPVLLTPADEIETQPARHRLIGAAAVADLLVRPVLRGRMPQPWRLAEARAAWDETDPAGRESLRRRLTSELGPAVAGALIAIAAGARSDPDLPRQARRRFVARSLAPANVAATWAQRRTVLPAGRTRGPLGLRTRGVLVALVGTDGAGKSTVADGLHERLRRYGLHTSAAYFGMARGNLPGVARVRRLLRAGDAAPSPAVSTGETALDHPALRQAAAWFYAGEYLWRYLRTVRPPLARRNVVIVDRWLYDLRESPWPGTGAARLAERLVPDPDVLVLPDAPIALIHRRKPERSMAEQDAQQGRFRRLLAERPARHAEMVVDTSGRTADPLAGLIAVVVQAAHSPRRRNR